MKKINLTKGQCVLVDDEDFEYLNQWKWYFRIHHSGQGYASRIIIINNIRKLIGMHRLIMNCPENRQVDHINGNKLDCRKINLRICTKQENGYNMPKRNKWKYKGIQPVGNKYRAYINFNNKMKHLGVYDTEKEAGLAYNNAARKYFGEFARLNNI